MFQNKARFMSVNDLTVATSTTQISSSQWQKQDTVWMLSLYGTAIGAGTLFLPINAGLQGIWPLLIMCVLAFPMTYFSHRALCRFVLSGSADKSDITEVVEEHFGHTVGKIITFCYFFSIYPVLLMYSVAITNTTQSFIVNQLKLNAPPRALLAIILVLGLMTVVRFGQQAIVKSMSLLVYPFVSILIFLSLYLVPYWNDSIFRQNDFLNFAGSMRSFMTTLWLIVPVMVFSFNHSPIISAFAMSQKKDYRDCANEKSALILKYSHLLMVITVMFFVFSCVLSLSPQDLQEAKHQNISILSYLANHFHTSLLAYFAPIIAFIAIAKSFLGHYLGASEGLQGLIVKSLRSRDKELCAKKLTQLIELFMILSCWLVATYNPSILGMIETLAGPIIAIILFLMPTYAIMKIPALQRYTHPALNCFLGTMGLITVTAVLYGLSR